MYMAMTTLKIQTHLQKSFMIIVEKLQKLIKVNIRASNANTRSMFHNKVESDATNRYIQSTHVFRQIDRQTFRS
jgi:hypothetical protein